MKALVLKPFRDAETGKVHKQGQTIEITDERFAEINGTSHGAFLQAIAEVKKPASKKPPAKKTTKNTKK